MRRRVVLLMLVMCGAAVSVDAQRGPRWTRLGARDVTDRADHDTIMVTSSEGRFNAVQFRVRGHAVDFQRVVIHFGNGEDQNVALRHTIPAGGESRVVDIDGRDRVIRSIEFWYDANTFGRGGHATVTVFGRH